MTEINKLKSDANALRRTVIEMAYKAGSGHCGGSLSLCDIMAALYGRVLRINPKEPAAYGRDRLVLSKGHAAPVLYAAMAHKGYFDAALLDTLRAFGSPLQGHPSMRSLPGIDMSTGSLGLGLSVACGMGLSMRRRGEDGNVWVLCGDGEMQEGCNWEALMSHAKWKLGNVKIIVDLNGLQLDGATDKIMPLCGVAGKMRAFGLHTIECDGNDMQAVMDALLAAQAADEPFAIVAHTVKGKGVPFMEGRYEWHGKALSATDYEAAKAALEAIE